ncbi:MAG: FtsQ-type POTRA domain-containing protein [Candidatus Omnitrophica bacterium]|nr:FtsQ-type POTRA domain-containing protein [Candidatus Omnitrophota bacterium]
MVRKKNKKKKNTRNKKSKIDFNPKIFIAIFLIFLGIGATFYLGKIIYESKVFTVKKIDSNVKLDDDLIASVKGRSLFTVNTSYLYKRISSNNVEYKDVSIVKKFPDTLRIEIVKRVPFAQIKAEKFFLIDRDGVILNSGQRTAFDSLIAIELAARSNPLHRGAHIKEKQLDIAFVLMDELVKNRFFKKNPVTLINITSKQALYFNVEALASNSQEEEFSVKVKVIVGEDDFAHKLHVFESLINNKIKADLHLVKYIDLRYKKAYIGYKR